MWMEQCLWLYWKKNFFPHIQYMEIIVEQLQSHIWLTASSILIYGEIFAQFLIYVLLGSPSSYMTLQLLHSEFPDIWVKFIFFFISVIMGLLPVPGNDSDAKRAIPGSTCQPQQNHHRRHWLEAEPASPQVSPLLYSLLQVSSASQQVSSRGYIHTVYSKVLKTTFSHF